LAYLALTDPSKQHDFEDAMQDVKKQVASVAVVRPARTTQSGSLKETLLSASKNLTAGMQNMLNEV